MEISTEATEANLESSSNQSVMQKLIDKAKSQTLIMGIINTTPDSFSGDGVLDPVKALDKALALEASGVDIVDVGGQSTRPGHQLIETEEELNRVIPAIAKIREKTELPISIDSFNPNVCSRALSSGANILNSVRGLDDELLEIAHQCNAPYVITHFEKTSSDVVEEVLQYLETSADKAVKHGVNAENIILDPGIGFGKTPQQNIELLVSLERFCRLGFLTLLGTSRKSFIGKLTEKEVDSREFGTAATVAHAISCGVDIVRVHDVESMQDVVKVSDAILRGWRPESWQSA